MTLAAVFPYPKFKGETSTGVALSGGKLYCYEPGTTTPKTTYTDRAMTVPDTHPIILDANGEALVYIYGIYKFVLTDANDVVQWTEDNLGGLDFTISDGKYYPVYSAADQGVTGLSNTIKFAVDTIGSDVATIVLQHNSGNATTTYTLTTSETIPANITLEMEPGAILDGVGTLTLDGDFVSGLEQAFGTSITVYLNKVDLIYAQWFGGTGDGVTDDSAAVQRAIDATELVFGHLRLTQGTWMVNDLLIDEAMTLSGVGAGTILQLNSDNESIIEVYRVGGQLSRALHMHDFDMLGGNYASGIGILFRGWIAGSLKNVQGNLFDNVMLDFDMITGDATTPTNANSHIENVWTGSSATFIRLNGTGGYASTQLFFSSVGGWCSALSGNFIDLVGNADNNMFRDVFIAAGGTVVGINLNSGDPNNMNNVYDNRFTNVVTFGLAAGFVPLKANTAGSLGGNTGPDIFTNCNFAATGTNPVIDADANIEFNNQIVGGLRYVQGFTATLTGCTTSPQSNIYYTKTNGTVTMRITVVTGTSNTALCSLTGLPNDLIPTRTQSLTGIVSDNNIQAVSQIQVSSDGTIYLLYGASGGFTSSGIKGLPWGVTLTYSLL